jgi:ABC-type lipoprotein release transport system permease subunit
MIKAFLKLAARNLLVHKRRNFITAIGLAIAFSGIILLGGYMLRMEGYLGTHTIYFRQVGHVSIWKKNGPAKIFHKPRSVTLTPEEQLTIRNALNLVLHDDDVIAPVLKGQGMITNGCTSFPILLTALEPAAFQYVYSHPTVKEKLPELTHLDQGRHLWDAPESDHPVMIARTLQGFLGKTKILEEGHKEADAAGALDCSSASYREKSSRDPYTQIFAQSFDGGLGVIDAAPVGLMQTGFVFSDETAVQLPLVDAQRLFATDNVTYFAVYLADPSRASSIVDQLQSKLDSNIFEVHNYRDEAVSEFYVGAMNFVYMMLMFFAVLICGVVILAVVNSFNIAFMERRAEIATLRSIGLKPAQLTKLLVLEYFILTALSLAAGGVLAFILKSINNSLNIRFRIPGYSGTLQFLLEPNLIFTIVTTLAFLILVVVTTTILTNKMNKKKIIDLTRGES